MLIHFNDGSDVYFAGDTGLTYDMRLIGDVGGVDLAALPIGDNFTMGRMTPSSRRSSSRQKGRAVPLQHISPIEQDVEAFAQKLQDETDIECVILEPGGTLTV